MVAVEALQTWAEVADVELRWAAEEGMEEGAGGMAGRWAAEEGMEKTPCRSPSVPTVSLNNTVFGLQDDYSRCSVVSTRGHVCKRGLHGILYAPMEPHVCPMSHRSGVSILASWHPGMMASA